MGGCVVVVYYIYSFSNRCLNWREGGWIAGEGRKRKRGGKKCMHPQRNTLPAQRRRALDKPFRRLQCPPDFQPVSKETCYVPKSLCQIKPERKQCEFPPRLPQDAPTGYQRRCLVLSGAGPAALPQIRGGEASNGGTVNVAERYI